jgi:hypothetical protein
MWEEEVQKLARPRFEMPSPQEPEERGREGAPDTRNFIPGSLNT